MGRRIFRRWDPFPGLQDEISDVEVQYRLYQTVPLYQDAISQSGEKPVADLW